MPPIPSLSALRERNVALIVAAVSISALGTGMAQVALAFAVLRISDASGLGAIFFARELPIVFFLLLGGVWADRVSRKRLLVLADLTTGAAQVATATLFLSGHATVWAVASLQILFGIALAFARPANAGLIAQAVAPPQLQATNALRMLGSNTMQVAGPALGAALVVVANPGWALAADAGTFFVSAVLRSRLRITRAARPARRHILVDLREGWTEFKSRSWVWTMVGSFGVFQLTFFPTLLVLGPVVAKEHLGGPGAWGGILACQAGGAAIGGIAALHLRFRRPLIASAIAMFPTAMLLAALGAAAPVWSLALASFGAAAFLLAGDIIWQSTFQMCVPEHLISRLSSINWLGSVALNPIGYALVGPLASRIGVAVTLYVAAGLNGTVALALLTGRPVRSFRVTSDPPESARVAATHP